MNSPKRSLHNYKHQQKEHGQGAQGVELGKEGRRLDVNQGKKKGHQVQRHRVLLVPVVAKGRREFARARVSQRYLRGVALRAVGGGVLRGDVHAPN